LYVSYPCPHHRVFDLLQIRLRQIESDKYSQTAVTQRSFSGFNRHCVTFVLWI
jgi:hypothetical protein